MPIVFFIVVIILEEGIVKEKTFFGGLYSI